MKVIFTSKRSIGMFALIISSILLLTLPNEYLYKIVLYFIGSVICLDGIVKLTLLNKLYEGTVEFTFDLIEGISNLVIGVIIVKFFNYRFTVMTCGIIYSITPIIRIIFSKHKMNQFVIDILKYLAAVILITSVDREYIVRLIVFIVFMSIAVIIFITLLIKIRKNKRGEYIEQS